MKHPAVILGVAYATTIGVGALAGALWALIARRMHPAPTVTAWPAETTPAQAEATLREQLEIDHTEWHQISCRLTEDLVAERAPLHDSDFHLWENEPPTREVVYPC